MAVSALAAGLISAGLATAGGIGVTSIQGARNKKMAKLQNEMNIENWNMQNEYNTPANQRKRLEEAGLNPALAYGGAGDTGNASSLAPYQNPSHDIGQSLMSTQQLASLASNIEAIQGMQLDNAKKAEELPYAGATAKAALDNYLADFDNKQANIALTRAQERKSLKELDKVDAEIQQIKTGIDDMLNQINIRTAQNAREERFQPLREALLVAQDLLAREQAKDLKEMRPYKQKQINSQISLNTANEKNVNLKSFMQEWENEFTKKHGVQPSQNVWTTLVNGIMSGISQNAGGLGLSDLSNPFRLVEKLWKDYDVKKKIDKSFSDWRTRNYFDNSGSQRNIPRPFIYPLD